MVGCAPKLRYMEAAMKLVCTQTDLNAKLSLLSRVVPTNPAHPVLANVLLQAEPNRVSLSVFDLSLGIRVWLPAEVAVTGAITVPARFFHDIISRLPGAPIEISTDELAITLATATGCYHMQGIDAEEFPALPELTEVEALTLPASTLLEGLQGTLFGASTDETKQMLTGLHLHIRPEALEFAATDGHRLAVATVPQDGSAAEVAVTIPAKALRELERLVGRQETTVTLRMDTSQVMFELATPQGEERLSCRLLEGQYPNYSQLLPKQFIRQVSVDRQLFLAAVDRIAVLASRKNNVIRLKLDATSQHLGLAAEAPEFGSGEELLPAQISGESLEVAFNVKYLSDGLKAMNSSEVQLQLNEATTPAVLSPLSGRKLTYLIMPIQIRS